MKNCPCHSGKPYNECCEPYHLGKSPENALALMRSRFSAYAIGLVNYIIDTTHPRYRPAKRFKETIKTFCKNTTFNDLKIVDFTEDDKTATVTFNAYLHQGKDDVSFQELSFFEKVGDKWYYTTGDISAV